MDDGLENVPHNARIFLRMINSSVFKNAARKTEPIFWGASDGVLDGMFEGVKGAVAFRDRLWNAIGVNISLGQKVKVSSLCDEETCTKQRIYQIFRDIPEFIVWLLRPMRHLPSSILPFVQSGIAGKIHEILYQPTFNSKGKINYDQARILLLLNGLLEEKLDNSPDSDLKRWFMGVPKSLKIREQRES